MIEPRTKFWAKLADIHFEFMTLLENQYIKDLKHLSDKALFALIQESLEMTRKKVERNAGEHLAASSVISACQRVLEERGLYYHYSSNSLKTKEEHFGN